MHRSNSSSWCCSGGRYFYYYYLVLVAIAIANVMMAVVVVSSFNPQLHWIETKYQSLQKLNNKKNNNNRLLIIERHHHHHHHHQLLSLSLSSSGMPSITDLACSSIIKDDERITTGGRREGGVVIVEAATSTTETQPYCMDVVTPTSNKGKEKDGLSLSLMSLSFSSFFLYYHSSIMKSSRNFWISSVIFCFCIPFIPPTQIMIPNNNMNISPVGVVFDYYYSASALSTTTMVLEESSILLQQQQQQTMKTVGVKVPSLVPTTASNMIYSTATTAATTSQRISVLNDSFMMISEENSNSNSNSNNNNNNQQSQISQKQPLRIQQKYLDLASELKVETKSKLLEITEKGNDISQDVQEKQRQGAQIRADKVKEYDDKFDAAAKERDTYYSSKVISRKTYAYTGEGGEQSGRPLETLITVPSRVEQLQFELQLSKEEGTRLRLALTINNSKLKETITTKATSSTTDDNDNVGGSGGGSTIRSIVNSDNIDNDIKNLRIQRTFLKLAIEKQDLEGSKLRKDIRLQQSLDIIREQRESEILVYQKRAEKRQNEKLTAIDNIQISKEQKQNELDNKRTQKALELEEAKFDTDQDAFERKFEYLDKFEKRKGIISSGSGTSAKYTDPDVAEAMSPSTTR